MFNTTNIIILMAFAFYLVMMVAIGFISMKKTKSTDDYFLGGRELSGPVAALSAQASDMSGWLLMGLPGSIYAAGTGQMWIAVGLAIGTILNWLFIAKPLRTYTIVANESMTLPEYFSNRFHDKKKILLTVSSVIIVIFFLVYTASALASGAKLFNSVFSIDYHYALIIGAAVILAYTFLGGFRAVCTTDFVQGMLMLVAILIVPIIAWGFVGGELTSLLTKSGVDASNFLNPAYDGGAPITFVSVISSLAWGLGYFGMPHILIRFMAIKNEKELSKSKKIAISWVVLSLAFAVIIGVIGRAYLYPTILDTAGAASKESVFIEMIKKLFIENLPLTFIAGIFLCGILAAIMSTADSQLLVCSSAVSSDIYKDIIKPDAKDKTVLNIGRITTVVVALIAIAIAWNPESSIMDLVSDAWAGFGSAFGPLVLLSLFWKRINIPGAVSGIISGAAVVIVWDYLPLCKVAGKAATIYAKTGLYSLVPGFAVSLICIVIVSLLTKAPSDEVLKDFEAYKNYKEEVKAEA